MKPYGEFDVYIIQSTVYVEPKSLDCDLEGAWEACHFIFGVVSLCRCRPCEKNLDRIFEAVEAYLGEDLECAQSFKVESKQSDKALCPDLHPVFPRKLGAGWRRRHPHLAGGCAPSGQYTVYVEVRDLRGLCPWTGGAGGGRACPLA